MYDIVIIGAGPAGLSAAIYGQRAGKETLLIDAKGFGGQIINTPDVENYPGIKKVSGLELATNLYEQATELGAEIVYEKAVGIEDAGQHKKVKTESASMRRNPLLFLLALRTDPWALSRKKNILVPAYPTVQPATALFSADVT